VAKAFSFIPIKLDSSNYIFWKAQILATLRAFDLVPFVNKMSPPQKYLVNSDSAPSDGAVADVVNPEYLTWMRSNQLLPEWLFSTIEKDILAQVIHADSSAEV